MILSGAAAYLYQSPLVISKGFGYIVGGAVAAYLYLSDTFSMSRLEHVTFSRIRILRIPLYIFQILVDSILKIKEM